MPIIGRVGAWRSATVQLSSNWDKVADYFANASRDDIGWTELVARRMGESVKKAITDNMRNTSGMTALSDKWKKSKLKYGFSPNPWDYQAWMVKHGIADVQVNISQWDVSVIVEPSKATYPSKTPPGEHLSPPIKANLLFRILEYGSSKNPPRPVLLPVIQQLDAGNFQPINKLLDQMVDTIEARFSSKTS